MNWIQKLFRFAEPPDVKEGVTVHTLVKREESKNKWHTNKLVIVSSSDPNKLETREMFITSDSIIDKAKIRKKWYERHCKLYNIPPSMDRPTRKLM